MSELDITSEVLDAMKSIRIVSELRKNALPMYWRDIVNKHFDCWSDIDSVPDDYIDVVLALSDKLNEMPFAPQVVRFMDRRGAVSIEVRDGFDLKTEPDYGDIYSKAARLLEI